MKDELGKKLNEIDSNNNGIYDPCETREDKGVGKDYCNAEKVAQLFISTSKKEEQEKKEELNQKLQEIELSNQEELTISLGNTTLIGISFICFTAILITFIVFLNKKRTNKVEE